MKILLRKKLSYYKFLSYYIIRMYMYIIGLRKYLKYATYTIIATYMFKNWILIIYTKVYKH